MSPRERPWMGLDRPELPEEELNLGIVGAPYDGSVTHERGAAEAPRLLRELSRDRCPLTEGLIDLRGLRLRDFGDVAVDNNDPEATQEAVRAADLLLLGVREPIPEELRVIREEGIEVLWARELGRLSPEEVAERIARKFADVPIYISFDSDFLDPAHAPGTGTPVPGGLSTRFLYDLVQRLTAGPSPRVIGFDLVEVAPPLDLGQITSSAGLGLLVEMFGLIACQADVAELGQTHPADSGP